MAVIGVRAQADVGDHDERRRRRPASGAARRAARRRWLRPRPRRRASCRLRSVWPKRAPTRMPSSRSGSTGASSVSTPSARCPASTRSARSPRSSGSTKCGMISCAASHPFPRRDCAETACGAAAQARAPRCRDRPVPPCMVSNTPSKLGSAILPLRRGRERARPPSSTARSCRSRPAYRRRLDERIPRPRSGSRAR